MDSSIGHEQVIEWEYIDSLTGAKSNVSAALVFYINNTLNDDIELNIRYKFEVIAYGFLGFYSAIGIKFMSEDAVALDEDYIDAKILSIVENVNLKSFIDFSIENDTILTAHLEKVKILNEELWIRYKEKNEEIMELRKRIEENTHYGDDAKYYCEDKEKGDN